jgi:hypothetical protein
MEDNMSISGESQQKGDCKDCTPLKTRLSDLLPQQFPCVLGLDQQFVKLRFQQIRSLGCELARVACG